MTETAESPVDRLWEEYGRVFRDFDDMTLARWMSQTLSQLEGRLWRMSHPLLGAYRLAAQVGHGRQIWLKRLVSPPGKYREANCCRAPLLPLFTRDILDTGLLCLHCGGTALPFDEIPQALQGPLRRWAEEYAQVHDVAHWDDDRRRATANYEQEMETAAERAERLLARAARTQLPKLLDAVPALVWEDQDECLDVRPEDIPGS